MKNLHFLIISFALLFLGGCVTKKEFLAYKQTVAQTNARIDSTNEAIRNMNGSISSLLERITTAETKTTEAYKDLEHYQNGEKSLLNNAVTDLQFRMDQIEAALRSINPSLSIQKKQEEEVGKKKKTSY